VPLKSARLAVKVISMLADAERASRLSFADVIKRLAEEPEGSPLFVSKHRERVERFVIVHGQIFLNQIKAFPKQVRAQ
jgi:DNA (cytosine-5)-methyltransferase 1